MKTEKRFVNIHAGDTYVMLAMTKAELEKARREIEAALYELDGLDDTAESIENEPMVDLSAGPQVP